MSSFALIFFNAPVLQLTLCLIVAVTVFFAIHTIGPSHFHLQVQTRHRGGRALKKSAKGSTRYRLPEVRRLPGSGISFSGDEPDELPPSVFLANNGTASATFYPPLWPRRGPFTHKPGSEKRALADVGDGHEGLFDVVGHRLAG